MAGWQCKDRETNEWDGVLKARSFIGDGSGITGVTASVAGADHTTLSNIGTNTHAQIDTHIASGAIHSASAAIISVLTSSGAVIASGAYVDVVIPFPCTIITGTMLPDASGSLVVNVKKCTYANYPGTFSAVGDYYLTSTTKSQTTGSGTLSQGDVVRVIASGAATATAQCTIALEVQRR